MHLGACLAPNRGPLLDLDRYSVGMISPPRKAWSPHSRIPGELETKIALFGFPHNGNRAASCLSPTLQCLAGLAPPILKIHIAERDAANRPEPAQRITRSAGRRRNGYQAASRKSVRLDHPRWSVSQKGRQDLIVRFRSRPPDPGTRNERPVRVEPPRSGREIAKVWNRRPAAGAPGAAKWRVLPPSGPCCRRTPAAGHFCC